MPTATKQTQQQRKGSWILTFSARQFWPLDPRADEVDPTDIAHALSLICRWTGHVRSFYSVAEHSVRVSLEVERLAAQKGFDEQEANALARWALMHDASEAYLADVARPVKEHPAFGFYRDAERALMASVCERFGLVQVMPKIVEEVDNRLLATEARDLMPRRPDWAIPFTPLAERITPWSPVEAERRFLLRLGDLWAVTY